jgi:Glycosyl hydrolases family 16
MGRPFLLNGRRARVSSWPPLRLVRLRRERVSVGVVPSQRLPIVDHGRARGVVRYIGMDVHREFAQLAVVEDDLVRDEGRIRVTPEALRSWAGDLRPDDQVALEATGNSDDIATLLTPLVARVVVSNPSKTRAIAEVKVKTDKVDARILGDFLGTSPPCDFYAYQHSDGNEGKGYRDPGAVKVKDGNLVITAKGDVSGAVGQNVKQQFGLWEIRAKFPKGAGTKPCILLWPGSERDAAGKATWPSWIEYDLVETNSERNGGYCNFHYGQTNTTGPHTFSGDLSQWHVYSCELSQEGVIYRLDGNIVKRLNTTNVISQHPHRLGIQLDVSSDGRTGPDTDMLVDWVRVAHLK